MTFQFTEKAIWGRKSSGWPLMRGAPWLAAIILSGLCVRGAHATTLLDPRPESSTTQFGAAIAVVGDIDGDGVPDLAVGAPKQDGDVKGTETGFGFPQNVGKVFVISGATLGVITELNDPEFQVPQTLKFGGQFGTSVAAIGDINGDGTPDILVGVPHHIVLGADDNLVNAGRAFVFSGSDGKVLFTLDDPTAEEGARMGFSACGLGDVNGDRVPDFAVGIPKKNVSEELPDVGTVYIFSGSNGSLIRSLNPPAQGGSEANGRFGHSVANAGDVDHDGVSDIVVGAPGQGHAFVFSSANGGLIFTLNSPTPERLPSFGFAVDGGKDLNGDGTADFVVGAPLQNNFKGAAYVFSGTDGSQLRKLTGAPQAFAKFGSAVALSRDITGDGLPDVLVGAPDQTVNSLLNAGQAYAFTGSNGSLFKTITAASPEAYAGFGSAITTGDFNGIGTAETVIGVPYEDANLIDETGDLVTHLQIGQIEIQ